MKSRFIASIFVLLLSFTLVFQNVFAYNLSDADKSLASSVSQKIENFPEFKQKQILAKLKRAYGKLKDGRTKSLVEEVLVKFGIVEAPKVEVPKLEEKPAVKPVEIIAT